MELSHINEQGRAKMVDVTDKDSTFREAVAEATVNVSRDTMQIIKSGGIKKGDVLSVAQVAGIMAAKKTPDIIPMCHPLMLSAVDIRFDLTDTQVRIKAEVKCKGNTGVEMEALTAVSTAALTVYDMCKAVQRDIEITDIRLLYKSGGKSGEFISGHSLKNSRSNIDTILHSPTVTVPSPKGSRMMTGTVIATCISENKGTRKHPVPSVTLKEKHGIIGDSHAGNWHRQISLLADESVDKMRAEGALLNAGDFAENILTKGVELKSLQIGTIIRIGDTELEVTQIGKKCHNDCEIRRTTGQCVMPTEGIFAIVIKGGVIRPGDEIVI